MAANVQTRTPLGAPSKASMFASGLGSSSGEGPVGIRRKTQVTQQQGSKEIRLSYGQLVVLWALFGGLLAMVFLFGLFAGRDQGMQMALEEYGRQAVRLPVAMPVATPEAAGSSMSAAIVPQVSIAPAPPTVNSSAPSGSLDSKKEAPIDFKAKSRLENLPPAPSVEPTNVAKAPATPEKLATAKPSSDFQTAPVKIADQKKAAAPDKNITQKPVAAQTAATETAPAKTGNEKINLPKGWYVQVAAAKTLGESVAIVNKLKALNLAAKLEQTSLKSETYFRILVGPFSTKQGANAEKDKVIRARASRGEPFVRLVE